MKQNHVRKIIESNQINQSIDQLPCCRLGKRRKSDHNADTSWRSCPKYYDVSADVAWDYWPSCTASHTPDTQTVPRHPYFRNPTISSPNPVLSSSNHRHSLPPVSTDFLFAAFRRFGRPSSTNVSGFSMVELFSNKKGVVFVGRPIDAFEVDEQSATSLWGMDNDKVSAVPWHISARVLDTWKKVRLSFGWAVNFVEERSRGEPLSGAVVAEVTLTRNGTSTIPGPLVACFLVEM